jgi:hypothetical protein
MIRKPPEPIATRVTPDRNLLKCFHRVLLCKPPKGTGVSIGPALPDLRLGNGADVVFLIRCRISDLPT